MKERKLAKIMGSIAVAMAITVTSIPAMPGNSTTVSAKATEVKKNTTKAVKFKAGKTFSVKLNNAKVKKTTFKSSKKKVATVDKKGKVTLKSLGKVKITMKSKGKKTVKLTVVSYGLSSVPTIIGGKNSYKVKGFTQNGKKTFKLKTSNTKLVKINGKEITGKGKNGTCTITAYYKKNGKAVKVGKFKVTCKADAKGVSATSLTVNNEFPKTISAWYKNESSTNGKFNFTSSNTKVAKVDKYGKVQAVATSGNAVITVKHGSTLIGKVNVTVKKFAITVTKPDGTNAKIGKLGNGKNGMKYLYKYNAFVEQSNTASHENRDVSALYVYLGDFFKNVSSYYTCELETPKNFKSDKWGEGCFYTPSFKQTCGTVKVEGVSSVDYDYDSEYKHQTVKFAKKNPLSAICDSPVKVKSGLKRNEIKQGYMATSYIASNGKVMGGSAYRDDEYSQDVCLSKIKVDGKYIVIEFVFNRKYVELGTVSNENMEMSKGDREDNYGLLKEGLLHPTYYQIKRHHDILGAVGDDFIDNHVMKEDKFKDIAFGSGNYVGYCYKHVDDSFPGEFVKEHPGDDSCAISAREYYEKKYKPIWMDHSKVKDSIYDLTNKDV